MIELHEMYLWANARGLALASSIIGISVYLLFIVATRKEKERVTAQLIAVFAAIVAPLIPLACFAQVPASGAICYSRAHNKYERVASGYVIKRRAILLNNRQYDFRLKTTINPPCADGARTLEIAFKTAPTDKAVVYFYQKTRDGETIQKFANELGNDFMEKYALEIVMLDPDCAADQMVLERTVKDYFTRFSDGNLLVEKVEYFRASKPSGPGIYEA